MAEPKPEPKSSASPSEYPAVVYHEGGTHVVVKSADEMKALGGGYSNEPNDKFVRMARKATGCAKTDQQPGVYMPGVVEPY